MPRPERELPPELYYDKKEAEKYTSSSRIIEIQASLTERALELLALPEDEPCLLLDIGCGSGLSSEVIEDLNHSWIGLDISQSMLDVCKKRELANGDTILGDMGEGLPFQPGCFDGAISISALQWLCNADKKSHNPVQRLRRLFTTLYACLSNGSRAVFQFYPEDTEQADLITKQAMMAGFTGGLVVDYPHSTKAKKVFLVLFTPGCNVKTMPKPITDEFSVNIDRKPQRHHDRRHKPKKKSRAWVIAKKELAVKKGDEVRITTRYTGRKRPMKF